MKKTFLPIFTIVLIAFSCGQAGPGSSADKAADAANSVESNKEAAALYHDLDSGNIDLLFTVDFVGHGENGHTWDRESHRRYLSNGRYKEDSIIRQIAEGDWVATMFIRTGEYQGDTVSAPAMQFKRFQDGKIAEVWEYFDFTEESEE